jgi:hypothetical protein
MKLSARIVPVHRLREAERERMWSIFADYYERVDKDQFLTDLAEKDAVILVEGAEIHGFSTMREVRVTLDGRSHVGMFSGDTVIERPYWGTRVLGRAFLVELAKRSLRHPLTPYWWILITKGYKTYLLMANNFPVHYPNVDGPTPEPQQRLMHEFGRRLFGPAYHPETGIVRFPESRGQLRTGIADISPELRQQNVRVAMFDSLNPHWKSGEELLCLARMNLAMPIKYAWKAWQGSSQQGPV